MEYKSFRNVFGFCYFKVKPKENNDAFRRKKILYYAIVAEL